MMRWLFGAAFLAGCFAATEAQAITPGSMCSRAGFDRNHEFRETCVSRVFRERRSNFWREEAPMLMLGAAVGAVASRGGFAFAVVSRRPDPGVYRINVDGRGFIVRIQDNDEVTVRSAVRYENVRERDVAVWEQAAQAATGCNIARRVRDFDALYVWLDCPTAGQAQPVAHSTASATPSGGSGAASTTTAPVFSIAEEIERLASLLQRGLITEAEFNAAKARLLRQ